MSDTPSPSPPSHRTSSSQAIGKDSFSIAFCTVIFRPVQGKVSRKYFACGEDCWKVHLCCPHRACPGGAEASAQERAAPLASPPPGLPRWSDGFCTREGRRTAPLVQKPPLHRGKPGGGGERATRCCSGAEAAAPPGQARWGRGMRSALLLLCRSRRSTGASPVGASLRQPSAKLPQQHLQAVAETTVDAQGRRRLEAAVDHAVLAARILAAAVGVPVGVVHQRLE